MKSGIIIVIVMFVAMLLTFLSREYTKQVEEETVQKNSLQILSFEPLKESYAFYEQVGLKLKFNKPVYFYIFTESKKQMIHPSDSKSGRVNFVDANRTIRLKNAFNIVDNLGTKDEKVILLSSTVKIDKYEKLLEEAKGAFPVLNKDSWSKVLEASDNMTIEYGDETEALTRGKSIMVKIREEGLKINIDSYEYRLGEDVDLDIKTLNDGYVSVFEATPTQNIKKLGNGKVERVREFRNIGTEASEPLGVHTSIAIYTKDNIDIQPDDFKVVAFSTKGGVDYKLEFKNEKYLYDIETFRVIN